MLVQLGVERHEVVVRAERRGGDVRLQRDLQRVAQQKAGFLHPAPWLEHERPRVQGVGEHLAEPQGLGQLQGLLDGGQGLLGLPAEVAEPPQLGGDGGQLLTGLLRRQDLVCAFHQARGLVHRSRLEGEFRDRGLDPGRGTGPPQLFEQRVRSLEVPRCLLGRPRRGGRLAGPLGQVGLQQGVVRQLDGLLVVALGLGAGAERGSALGRAHEHVAGPVAGLGVGGVGPVRFQVVGGHHLHDLLLLGTPRLLQVRRGRQVAEPPLVAGQGVVRDRAHEVLEEPVLAVLGRAGVRLDAQDLLAHQRRQDGLDVLLGEPGQCRQGRLRRRLAEHGGVLDQPALIRGQAVQPRRDERVERLWDLELLHRAGGPVLVALPHQQPPVQEHPDRLHRVQRDALGAREDLRPGFRREARDQAVQECLHGARGQRL